MHYIPVASITYIVIYVNTNEIKSNKNMKVLTKID